MSWKTEMKSNKELGAEWVRLALLPSPVLMNRREAAEHFGVQTDRRIHHIKVWAQKYAAKELGVAFGYDPTINKFRVVPDNANTVAESVYQYHMHAIAMQHESNRFLVEGFWRQKYISDTDAAANDKTHRECQRKIKRRAMSTKFEFPEDDAA